MSERAELVSIDPDAVCGFWFAGAGDDPERIGERQAVWYGGDPAFDEAVRVRFEEYVDPAARGELDHWHATPRGTLALIVLLDQMPRHVWRGSARAFAHDRVALALARDALARGVDRELRVIERLFVLLPLQHAEDAAVQAESVSRHAALVAEAPAALTGVCEGSLAYAREHRDLIDRFGRFPHRNAVLGRAPTPEEQEFLAAGGARFGQ